MRNKSDDDLSREASSSGGHAPAPHRVDRAVLPDLVEHARFEVLPTAGVEEQVLTHLPIERMLTVTASSSRGLDAVSYTHLTLPTILRV